MIRKLKTAQVAAIPNQMTTVTAGTAERRKVERKDDVVIKILRNRVVIISLYCYHNKRARLKPCLWKRQKSNFGRGRFCLLSMVTILYDNIKGLRIKQSAEKLVRLNYPETIFILNDFNENGLI